MDLALVSLTVIANFFIAFIVIRNNYKSETNVSLAGLTAAIALWAVPNYLYATDLPYDQIVFWMRGVFFVTGFMLAFLLYFTLTFPEPKLSGGIVKKLAIFLPSIIVGLMSYTDLIVSDANIVTTGTHIPVFGGGMISIFYMFWYTSQYL